MYKKGLRCLAVLAGASLFLTACQLLPAEETFPASPVIRSYEVKEYKLANVMRGDLVETKKVVCNYMPVKQESHSFVLDGEEIEGIYVTNGQEVKAGQLLAELNQGSLKEQIDSLEYQLQVLDIKLGYIMKNWELEMEILKAKYDKDSDTYAAQYAVVDARYILEREANRDEAYIKEQRLKELKADLADRRIYAGMDGMVTYVREVQEGAVSVEGREMITIADMATTAFAAKGDSADYFVEGMEVVISIGKKELEAVCVNGAEFGLEEAGNTAYFKLLQPDPTLESGHAGSIEAVLDLREDALYVDRRAIETARGKQFVYILNEEGLRESRDVTVGKQFGNVVEILSGLKEGDSVILE